MGGGGGESRFAHGHETVMHGNLWKKHVPSGPHRHFIGPGYHAALLLSRILRHSLLFVFSANHDYRRVITGES